jgi:hypothetical protein
MPSTKSCTDIDAFSGAMAADLSGIEPGISVGHIAPLSSRLSIFDHNLDLRNTTGNTLSVYDENSATTRSAGEGDARCQRIAINSLLGSHSPRLNGEDVQHVNVLASTGTSLPPIIVHRQTMRVIDGMHRLRAAQMLGQRDIAVEFFDGSEDEAFVRAVQANTAHGLPLSLADREAAATRILRLHPDRSDRWIAGITGLAAKTVCAIRRRMGMEYCNNTARVGQDGRVRPIDSAQGRRIARDMLTAHPEASLRQIARTAGISPGTVRDVRKRLQNGDDPIRQRTSDHGR